MTLLSPKGLHAVEELAHRTGFSQEAVTSMLFSIVSGRGGMCSASAPLRRIRGFQEGRISGSS
jgi:hypothetical protein